MRILYLALKDLSQILRDKMSILFLVLMPVVFTVIMSMAYGSSSTEEVLKLGWANADPNGALSAHLRTLLEADGGVELVELDPAQFDSASERVRRGEWAGAVRVPADFSQLALAGSQPSLEVLADSASTSGQAAAQITRTAFVRVMSAAQAALQTGGDGDSREALLQRLQRAVDGWSDPTLSVAVEKAAPQAESHSLADDPYAQSSPGMIVQFTLFGLVSSAMIVVLERRGGTLQRLMTTSMPRSAVLAGHFLAMFVTILAQEILLVLFGQLALGLDYFSQPLAVGLILVSLALWVASLGLLIGAAVKGQEQVILWAMVAMFVFSALGGAWFPLEGAGPAFAALGRVLPSAWAMTGFQNILLRGLGAQSALLPAAVLGGYALLCFGLAAWRFLRSEA